MEHVYLKNIGDYVGQEVEIKGWLYNKAPAVKFSS